MLEYLNDTRLAQLKALLEVLAASIDDKPGARDLAQLSKQYRETLREIEEMEGETKDNDEIGELLAERAADGKPGAVRKNRAGLCGE
jgi:hypothetical protein